VPLRQLKPSVAVSFSLEVRMNKNNLPAKWKVHFLFGGGLLLVILINVAMNSFAGQTFLRVVLGALSGIRPVEYVMFILFWYWFARGQHAAASRPEFTSLNIDGSKH
jgi:hypothetical protein